MKIKNPHELIQFIDANSRIDLSSEMKHFAVVGVQIRSSQNKSFEILYIKRAQREGDPWSGQIGFPGGHHDETDQSDYLNTLKREYKEEMGCEFYSEGQIALLDDLQARKAGELLPFYIRPVCFISKQDEFNYQEDEIAGHIWVSLEHLLDVKNRTSFKMLRQNMKIDLPAIKIFEDQNEPVLWGLTYMMTMNLIDKIKRAKI